MLHPVRLCAMSALAVVAACSRGAKTDPAPAVARPLAAYSAQRVVVAPTVTLSSTESDPLVREFGSGAALTRFFDGELASQLKARGVGPGWVLPDEVVRAFERNRTYASDPRTLAVEPLRAAGFTAGSKYGEPLSTQLRTMIAFHQDARLVLVPATLRLHDGKAVLRVALLDPRFAEARWVADIASDSAAVPSRTSLTQVAARLAGHFVTAP